MSFAQTARILGSRRSVLALAAILLITSAAFDVTSSILLSVNDTASGILGESSDTIVVTQGSSRAPFLGTLPLALAGDLGSVSGIKTISPEVFAPSTLSNRPVMVRGVDPERFMQIQSPVILEGSPIAPNDTTLAMVGVTLSRQLGIHPGSLITLVGGVQATIAQLTVKGVFSTGTTLDNEVVAPIWVGDWLRGVSYGTVTILRIQVGPGQDPSQVALAVQRLVQNSTAAAGGGQAPVENYLPANLPISSFVGLHIQASPDAAAAFFNRAVGLSEANIWLVSALVFVSMSVAIVCALQEAVFRSRNELGVLRTVGMSSRSLSWNLIAAATSVSFVASAAGLLIGWTLLTLFADYSPIQLAFYAVDPRSALVPASIVSVAVVTVASFAAAAFSSLRFRQPLLVHELTLPYLEYDVGDVGE